MPRFITQALAGEPLTIHGDGHASRDWLYVDDHAEAIEALIDAPIDAARRRGRQRRDGRRHLGRRDRRSRARRGRRPGLDQGVRRRAARAGRPPHRLDGQDGRLTGWRARTELRRRARADRRLVPRERGLVAERPRSQPARLLVLGAGRGAARPARGGRAHATSARDRGRPRPARARLRASRTSARSSRPRTRPAIERLARARDVDGIISPGADWPVGIAARVAERLGLPHPISGATAVLATTKTRQRERFAAAGVAAAADVLGRRSARSRSPASSRRPTGRASAGSRSSATPAELAAAVETARRRVARRRRLVEELIDGPELTVNAVSFDGEFVPLTVTDRILAEPPAFGVALAHVWPSAHDDGRRGRGGPGSGRGARDRERPDLHPDPARPRRPALRDRGRGPARRRPRRRALPRRRPESTSTTSRSRSRSAILVTSVTSCWRRLRPHGQAGGAGGACVLFLVAPEGVLRQTVGHRGGRGDRGRRVGAGLPAARVASSGRSGAAPTGPARCSPRGRHRDDALARARRAAEAVRFLVDAAAS